MAAPQTCLGIMWLQCHGWRNHGIVPWPCHNCVAVANVLPWPCHHGTIMPMPWHCHSTPKASTLPWQCCNMQGPTLTCTSAYICLAFNDWFAQFRLSALACHSLQQHQSTALVLTSPHHLTLRRVAILFQFTCIYGQTHTHCFTSACCTMHTCIS